MQRQRSYREYGEHIRRNEQFKVVFTIVGFSLVFIIWGMIYLIQTNAGSLEFTGTLIQADVITSTSCNNKNMCSTYYYVTEIFTKDNSTNTCTVQRLTPYSYRGDANNVAINKILGTTRKVWTVYYSAGTCIDQSIKNYYNTIGGVLLGFGGSFLAFFLIIIFFEECIILYEYLSRNCRNISYNNNEVSSREYSVNV